MPFQDPLVNVFYLNVKRVWPIYLIKELLQFPAEVNTSLGSDTYHQICTVPVQVQRSLFGEKLQPAVEGKVLLSDPRAVDLPRAVVFIVPATQTEVLQ